MTSARYPSARNWGARAYTTDRAGIEAVVLENRSLRITVLSEQGTDVVEFNYKPHDLDFVTLWREGVQAPNAVGGPVTTGAGSFHDAYRGGWQEVLPNGGPPCSYEGAEYGQHGEVARLAWDHRLLVDDPEKVTVEFRTLLTRSPLILVKRLTLSSTDPTLVIDEELTNPSPVPQRAMWGQHLVFGPPFLTEDCQIELEEGARIIPHPPIEGLQARRLDPGREHRWPTATGADGEQLDLSRVPARGAPTEMAYITGLEEGRYAIVDGRGLGLEVNWDRERFPYLWLWQELGASKEYPWYGAAYLLGLEPFSSFPSSGLQAAVDNDTALSIAPGETLITSWSVQVLERGR